MNNNYDLKDRLTGDELIVYNLIEKTKEITDLSAPRTSGRITQQQIANSAEWLGSHPEEAELKIDHRQTTLRKVRQIIRTLRLTHGAKILSDKKGYYFPANNSEVTEYIQRLEKVARAQSLAWLETYSAMKVNFGAYSEYFEAKYDQLKLEL